MVSHKYKEDGEVESVATLWSITQDTDLYQQGIENSSHNMCPLWLAVCGEVVGQQYNP